MNRDQIAQVAVCAGGLGTRVSTWARHIPKEFTPVAGRPGMLHLLDELTVLAPARVVVVYHPFYEPFIAWAKHTLGRGGLAAYQRAARLPRTDLPLHEQLELRFVPQKGRYADVTSVLNAAGYLRPDDLYVAFADNLYPHDNATLALSRLPAGQNAVLVRPYRPEEAAGRGVIISRTQDGELLLADLIEKPSPDRARELEYQHGTGNLWLLEGRARLTGHFTSLLKHAEMRPGPEPKLSLAIRDHACIEPVRLIVTGSRVVDLGTAAATLTAVR